MIYPPAPSVTQSFTVNPLPQTITFSAISPQFVNTSAGIALTATADSGLPVTYNSTTPAICTVSGSATMLLAIGTCTIQANQAGNSMYAAAPMVMQSFIVQTPNLPTSANFGAVNIGTASSAIDVPLTVNTAATLGSVSVMTQGANGLDFASASGGTCATGTTYQAGAGCTVNITFTPTLAGTRYGAVVLEDGSGNVLATGFIQGSGVGPQVNFLPNAESTVSSSALSHPSGVALDAIGNIYIADTYNQRVLKETFTAGSYTESTVPTSPLSYPYGVAVDGSGNLYIADTGDNRVLKETFSAGSYIESTVPSSSLNGPFGVAVDGSGNVYIADTYNNRVLIEMLSAGNYTESAVPSSALNAPFGVAVDGSGNVYIADSYHGRVLKETLSAGSYAESTVPTSALGSSDGIAVDGSGNLYISNYYGWGLGNSNVLKETLSAGSYIESTVQTSALNAPFGIASDGAGNVYIADTDNNRILKEDFADPPSLTFALTAPGSTSSDSPQTVTLENVGNATLSFPIPSGGNNPGNSANFILNNGEASSCPLMNSGSSAAGTLFPGRSCLLSIGFAPTEAGNLSGTLTLTDNALNATAPGYTAQSIQLSGTGTGGTQQTITFGPILGQDFHSTFPLTAAASSGLPISFTSATPATCTVSGSTASLLALGICSIQANQTGSSVYSAAPMVTQNFAVNPIAQTITFGAIPAQIITATAVVRLTATVNSYLSVSYTSTTPANCTVSGSTATLLAVGTCTIQASQAGYSGPGSYPYAAAPTVTRSFNVEYANPLVGQNFGAVNIGSPSTTIAVPLNFSGHAGQRVCGDGGRGRA
jgi:sugar lactone lactonase YvrE